MNSELTLNHSDSNSVVVYHSEDGSIQLVVQLSDETVWLTQQQMMALFETSKQNVSLHINNIFREGELIKSAVVKDYLTTAADGKNYRVQYYNLDVIISVGYRVKSKRGTQFRQWANQVLKDYLLRGYAINQRVARLEEKVAEHDKKIDFFVRTSLLPVEGVFYNGQIFDAYVFASDLIKSAKESIVLIDNYIDESVLMMLAKRDNSVKAKIITRTPSRSLIQDIERHNEQYPKIGMEESNNYHDRFLIIDSTVYHLGASLKDLGKKLFAFSKMETPAEKILPA